MLRGLSGTKLTKPGTFRDAEGTGHAVRCSYKVRRRWGGGVRAAGGAQAECDVASASCLCLLPCLLSPCHAAVRLHSPPGPPYLHHSPLTTHHNPLLATPPLPPHHTCVPPQADDGHLYPLERAFFYVQKPPLLLVFDDVDSIEFMRQAAGATSAKTFDLAVRMRNGSDYLFRGIPRWVGGLEDAAKQGRENDCCGWGGWVGGECVVGGGR